MPAFLHQTGEEMRKFIYGIRFKIIVLMLAFTLIPTLLTTGGLYRIAKDMVTREIQYNQMTGLESMVKFTDSMLRDVDMIASNILANKDLSQMISVPLEELEQYQNYKNSISIKSTLDTLARVNENIDSIYLYDRINNRVFSTKFYGYAKEDTLKAVGMEHMKTVADSESQWNVVFEGFGEKNKVFLSNRKHQYKNGEEIFTFFINLDQGYLNSLLEEFQGNPSAWYYIEDEKGQRIAFTSNANFELDLSDDSYYVVSKELKPAGWNFVSVVPFEAVFGKLNRIRNFMLIIYGITVGLLLLFGIYMNRLIYVPIKKLTAAMIKNKEGVLSTCEISEKKDEFGEIAYNFNELILAQDSLNKKLREKELMMKNTEIRFLQSQINPHFLYNVLDTIHWMARMGRNEDVAEMTFALARFYRSSLSEGRELIPVSEAIQLAAAYFEIQKIRFQNRIELIIDVESSILNILVPKRLFQPIMENAVNHGMANSDRKGFLILSGIDLEENVKFIIEDNGAGLDEEAVNQINREIAEGDFNVPGNYALKNLNSQLKMIYGEKAGLWLESTPGKGTTVIVLVGKHGLEGEM